MLNLDVSALKNKKNLLAFSAGVDSSALFFLLIDHTIKFDIAIVEYDLREQSKEEVKHAKALARKHKLFCHHIKAPTFDAHFEQKARDFRYEFFDSLVSIEGYDTVITAHQLNDQLEWFFMRLSKGAGLSELLGLKTLSQRENYTLVRPLLSHSKEELLDYLHTYTYPYFVDESNKDEKYERNKFREKFSDAFMAEYSEGIKRSFRYLNKDKMELESTFETIAIHLSLHIIKLHTLRAKVKAADLTLKKLGYLLSAEQRKEIEKENSLVIGGQWVIEIQDNFLYIAPFHTEEMPKTFKESCRIAKIPNKIRPYLFKGNISVECATAHL